MAPRGTSPFRSPGPWLALLAAVACASPDSPVPPSTSPAQLGGPLPGPFPLFPPDNWWNQDVSRAPLDPSSAAYIRFIGTSKYMHPEFAATLYGMPYVVVSSAQPKRTVTFRYDGESDHVGYPIPDEAITQTGWIEGMAPGNRDLRDQMDRHMLIVDRDSRLLYELYSVFWDGSKWLADSGARFDMKTNERRPEGWTSADAAGLAILPGLVRWEEAYGFDEIRHAFRVTVRRTNNYVWPASHGTGPDPEALPMGARLRLKSATDISRFPAEMQRIFRAMKTYGLIVADNGADMFVTGTNDSRWDNDIVNPAFHAITAADFEVVQLGWRPATLSTAPNPRSGSSPPRR
jgi:hypothetical protein